MTSSNNSSKFPKIYNVASAFIEFWNKVELKSPDEQLTILKKEFIPKFSQFYEYKIEKWKKVGENPDDGFKKQLAEFPKIKTEFLKKTNEIINNLDSALESFVREFPDFDRSFDVYITHSFGDMDGGTRKIGDKIYFILGIDGMVKYHRGFSSEIPFFHHELFHVYHDQHLPEERVMWHSLWVEGLATYVSHYLNPKASLKDIMLDIPDGMATRINADLDYHWQDIREKLTSQKDNDYAEYFLIMPSHESRIIMRSGYYLGYLLAQEICKTKSISELVKLNIKEIQPMLKNKIDQLSALKK